jgi:hypothetical protein
VRAGGPVTLRADGPVTLRAGGPVAVRCEAQPEGEDDVDPLSRRSLIGTGAGAVAALGAGAAPAVARRVDPQLVEHWMALLRLLDAHTASSGPRDALGTIRHQVGLIAAHREVARGRLCTELLRVEARWAEFASWLCQDTGDGHGGDAWATRCLRLARAGDEPDTVGYALMWRSQDACERARPRQAVAFAQAALDIPGLTSRIRGLCTEQEAYAHALAGDRVACERGLDRARGLLAAGGPPPWGDLAARAVAAHYALIPEARCRLWLDPARAVALFDDALRAWPDEPRSRGVQQARLALACAAADEPERAAAEGLAVLDVERATRSSSIARKLDRLDRRLAASDLSAVTEFREAYAAR